MIAVHGRNNRFGGQLRDRLKTTSMGLGLVRLQMDAGLTEEASTTLASLQDNSQLLLFGVENLKEMLPSNRRFEKWDSCDWNEKRLNVRGNPPPDDGFGTVMEDDTCADQGLFRLRLTLLLPSGVSAAAIRSTLNRDGKAFVVLVITLPPPQNQIP